MLYYEETVIFEPDGKNDHWRENYWKDFQQILAPHMGSRGMHVVGVWETPVGAGNGNEITLLYRTKDWTSYGQFLHGGQTDMKFRERWAQQWVYRQHWFTKVIRPAPGHVHGVLHKETEAMVEPGPAKTPSRDRWVYYEETTIFEPDGKNDHWRSKYWEDFGNILAPRMAAWGVPLVGVWETPVGAGHGNEFTFLWRAKDWATFGEFLDGRKKDDAFRKRWGQQWVYRQKWFTKLILPAPGHAAGILRRQAE